MASDWWLESSPADRGKRLDTFLRERLPEFSRERLQDWIEQGRVRVDGAAKKRSHLLKGAERIHVQPAELAPLRATPEDLPLDVLYEDADVIAINKPAGMVVHTGAGQHSGTLVNAVLHRFGKLSSVGGDLRPGIVHRLDRDTSGVLVVAKTDRVHFALAEQFEQRTTEKEYFAIVVGTPDRDRDLIDQPIGVHPYQREKMAIRRDHATSRPAQTYYEVLERFDGYAALRIQPKTGRTHQIRVHLNHIGHPVLCDKLYGGRAELTRGHLRRDPAGTSVILNRQALHAARLAIAHPETGQRLEFIAPLPADIAAVLEELRHSRASGREHSR